MTEKSSAEMFSSASPQDYAQTRAAVRHLAKHPEDLVTSQTDEGTKISKDEARKRAIQNILGGPTAKRVRNNWINPQ